MRQRVERALSGSRKEGALVVIREPQRLLRGACERGVSSAVMQAGRTHDVRVAVRIADVQPFQIRTQTFPPS